MSEYDYGKDPIYNDYDIEFTESDPDFVSNFVDVDEDEPNASRSVPEFSLVFSLVEVSPLARLEAIIDKGREAFLAVGNALATIREQELYKPDYDKFEEYLAGRWGFTRQHASRLIKAAGVVATLSPIGDSFPATEYVARKLGEIEDPDDRNSVWAIAKRFAGDKEVTGAMVKAAGTVLETLKATGGYVDLGTGGMDAITAAVTVELSNTLDRQREHIRNGSPDALFKDVVQANDAAQIISRVLAENPAATRVRVLIYLVDKDSK